MSEELFEKMVRHLSLELTNQELTEELLTHLEELLSQHKGNKELKFQIKDPIMKANISMVSSEWKVAPNGVLVKELEELGVKYRLV